MTGGAVDVIIPREQLQMFKDQLTVKLEDIKQEDGYFPGLMSVPIDIVTDDGVLVIIYEALWETTTQIALLDELISSPEAISHSRIENMLRAAFREREKIMALDDDHQDWTGLDRRDEQIGLLCELIGVSSLRNNEASIVVSHYHSQFNDIAAQQYALVNRWMDGEFALATLPLTKGTWSWGDVKPNVAWKWE